MDIVSNLNTTISQLYTSVTNEIFSVLDNILQIKPDILKYSPLSNVLNISEGSYVFAVIACFITLSGISFVIQRLCSMYSGESNFNAYKYILKVIIYLSIATSSIYIDKVALNILDLSTNVVMEMGEKMSGEEISFKTLSAKIKKIEKNLDDNFLSIDGMLKGIIIFSFTNLLINLSVRYVWVIFLLLVSPLAIMLNVSETAQGIFKSWCKSIIINLSYQVIVKLILIIPITFKSDDEMLIKIVLLGTMYILYKLGNYIQEIFQLLKIGKG